MSTPAPATLPGLDLPAGAVIRFRQAYRRDGRMYQLAAIRAGDLWYLTDGSQMSPGVLARTLAGKGNRAAASGVEILHQGGWE